MATDPNIGNYLGIGRKSDFNIAQIVEKGLPTEKLARLREEGLTLSEISEVVIPARTLKHRKARRESLSHEETDRLVRVARILALAASVFADREKGLRWLRAPDENIGGRAPMSLLPTEAGGRLVESMLWQVDEGVYS